MGGNLHAPVRDQPSHRGSPRNTTDASTGGPPIAVGTAPCRSPMELLEKLAALVPPPRFHLLRYHGVLAPRARDRGRIVPAKPVAESTAGGDTSAPSCTHRLGWADPAGAGVGRRPQRMRNLWRAPEDHRRPDRCGLDPDLFGGHRAAGGASAEGPAAAAVRVRSLTSSAPRASGGGPSVQHRTAAPPAAPGRSVCNLAGALLRPTHHAGGGPL